MFPRIKKCTQSVLLAASLAVSGSALAELPEPQYDSYTWEKEIFVPMRDGTRLSTDVLLPKGAKGKLPTVLVRSPYHKDNTHWAYFSFWDELFLKHGYAVVIQNERGRQFSEGYFQDYLQGAADDGYDTLEWISNQPWSNGKVVTLGSSSAGEQQWAWDVTRPPAQKARHAGTPGRHCRL